MCEQHEIEIQSGEQYRLPGFVVWVDGYKVGDRNVSYLDEEWAEQAAERFIEKLKSEGLNAALAMRN